MLTPLRLQKSTQKSLSRYIVMLIGTKIRAWVRDTIWPPEAPPGTPYLQKKAWKVNWEEEDKQTSKNRILDSIIFLVHDDCKHPVRRATVDLVGWSIYRALSLPSPPPPRQDPVRTALGHFVFPLPFASPETPTPFAG